MVVLYRISDGSALKNKLPFGNKIFCLDNFCNEFKNEKIIIFADNCKSETIQKLKHFNREIIQISEGNSGSWRFCAEYARNNFDDNEIIYMVEDDYLHLPGSASIIKEGMEIADYVTLYDHPLMYVSKNEGGNPFVKRGGEVCRVLLTKSSHWKTTNSTTMTFAVKVKTLKADKLVWNIFTSRKIPKDFMAFKFLGGRGSVFYKIFGKRRVLITPIPGYSTHIETATLSPLRDWYSFDNQISIPEA